jgi:hypothetical protein
MILPLSLEDLNDDVELESIIIVNFAERAEHLNAAFSIVTWKNAIDHISLIRGFSSEVYFNFQGKGMHILLSLESVKGEGGQIQD